MKFMRTEQVRNCGVILEIVNDYGSEALEVHGCRLTRDSARSIGEYLIRYADTGHLDPKIEGDQK